MSSASSTKKGDAKHDQESLMALHALLQIRSKSGTSSNAEGQGEEQEGENKFAKPPRKRAKKIPRASARAMEQASPSPANERQSGGGLSLGHLHSLSSSVSFPPSASARDSLTNMQAMNAQPMHGFLNLATAPSPMSSSAAQFSAAINALMQPSPIGINQRFMSSQFRLESDVPVQYSNSAVHDQYSQQGPTRFTGRDLVASMEDNSLKIRDPHGITPATSPSPTPDELIRREEVEAALKSKPQRGRKRENLNVMERLELTRTRNREHAKSTRIRKKQRYQELVDNERRLEALQSAEDLNLLRRQCVMKFVNIREQMLNNLRGGSAESSTEEVAHKPACLRRGSVSFCNLQDSMNKASGDPKEEVQLERSDAASLNSTEEIRAVVLNDVIDNLSSFVFKASPLGSTSWVRPEGVHALTGVTTMKRFDNSILSLLQQHLNDVAIPALSYTVQGSFEGIAVNAEGKGFARVDLELKGIEGRTSQALVSSILTMQFATDTDKLVAAEWSVVVDRLSPRSLDVERQGGGGQDNRSDSGESLASQTVYPSVVSLDHNGTSGSEQYQAVAAKGRPSDVDEGGPGMSI